MGTKFLSGKPPTLTVEKKKPWGLRPTNPNPLYEGMKVFKLRFKYQILE